MAYSLWHHAQACASDSGDPRQFCRAVLDDAVLCDPGTLRFRAGSRVPCLYRQSLGGTVWALLVVLRSERGEEASTTIITSSIITIPLLLVLQLTFLVRPLLFLVLP